MINGFTDTAYQGVLVQNSVGVDEPENPSFLQPRAPTTLEKDGVFVPLKYDYDSIFNCPVFKGKLKKRLW